MSRQTFVIDLLKLELQITILSSVLRRLQSIELNLINDCVHTELPNRQENRKNNLVNIVAQILFPSFITYDKNRGVNFSREKKIK